MKSKIALWKQTEAKVGLTWVSFPCSLGAPFLCLWYFLVPLAPLDQKYRGWDILCSLNIDSLCDWVYPEGASSHASRLRFQVVNRHRVKNSHQITIWAELLCTQEGLSFAIRVSTNLLKICLCSLIPSLIWVHFSFHHHWTSFPSPGQWVWWWGSLWWASSRGTEPLVRCQSSWASSCQRW